MVSLMVAGIAQTVAGASAEIEPSSSTLSASQALPSSLPENTIPTNCRYGVAALWTAETAPWLPYVGAGWYLNFSRNPVVDDLPNHAEYVYTLRMKDGVFDPPLSANDAKIAADPGQVWLVGNEIEVDNDSTGDGTYPEDYAVAYHTAYHYIKERDPSAQIAFGGMSMATPARLQYLDLAWNAYQDKYGVDMPVDVWNIHIYILNEWKHFGNNQGDGRVALGTDTDIAKRAPNGPAATECPKEDVYCRAEHDSITILEQQIRGMRQWMKDNGQQDKPLIISEFGLLFQPGNQDEFGVGFKPDRVNAYMEAAFDYLETAKDPSIGYPADENRLVQRWLWYGFVTEPGWSGHSSDLLKQDFRDYELGDLDALNTVGMTYRSEVQKRSVAANLVASSVSPTIGDGSSAPIRIGIRNTGTSAVAQPFTVTFYADEALTQVIGSTTVDSAVNGCHWHNDTHSAEINWSGLSTGVHTFWAKVDSGNSVAESSENDNIASGSVYVNTSAPTATPTPVADQSPPSVSWQQPVGNGQTHDVGTASSVALQANASDDVGVVNVKFERWDATAEQWVLIGNDDSAPFTASVTSAELANGFNQVSAIAWDAAGNASPPMTIWLNKDSIANETPTPAATATSTSTPVPTATATPSAETPLLQIGSATAYYGEQVTLPVTLTTNGADVGSAVFGINYDELCLGFNGADSNDDGLPDGVALTLPDGYFGSVTYQPSDTNGELDVLIARQSDSTPALTDGSLMTLTLTTRCDPFVGDTDSAEVDFAASPVPALANLSDQPLTVQTLNGGITIASRNKAYQPVVVSP